EDPESIALAFRILLETGEAEEVRAQLLARFNPVTVLPPAAQPTFRDLHLQAAAVLGDYDRAADELNANLATVPKALFQPIAVPTETGQVRELPGPVPRLLQALVLPDMVGTEPFTRMVLMPEGSAAFQMVEGVLRQEAELHLLRGELALESGDVAAARRQFGAALPPAVP